MVVVEPRHVAMWARANELTRPATDEQPPTYGAWHRQRAERRMPTPEVPVEQEAPEIEGLAVR
jgi:hypothetical protein